MTLTRTHTSGRTHAVGVVGKAEARRRVAWCATDNLGYSRAAATKAAAAFPADLDEPYVLGPYTFVLTQESS